MPVRLLTFVFITTLSCSTGLRAQSSKTKVFKAPAAATISLRYRRTDSEKDYIGCTASFEYATRDDQKRVNNDWDLCLQGHGIERYPYTITPRTVTNDKSEIWDLGEVKFEEVRVESHKAKSAVAARWDQEGRHGLTPRTGHVYLLHTLDDDSDFWTKFEVIEITPNKGVTISWQLLTRPQRMLDKARKKTL
ncbi:MAG: hypothetical protein KDB18_11450 [Salinibacterium sp.]|nr:hypothetical protein [Salinibacterium sp.]